MNWARKITVDTPPPPPEDEVGAPEDFAEKLALFCCAIAKDRAVGLLNGLAERGRLRAQGYAEAVLELSSPSRKARIALDFRDAGDAGPRLRRLVRDAGPLLREELCRQMPDPWREVFQPFLPVPEHSPPPLLVALASRLIKEALG